MKASTILSFTVFMYVVTISGLPVMAYVSLAGGTVMVVVGIAAGVYASFKVLLGGVQ